ncbi:MAG TPA: RidA family protein [Paenirhodobacter sp.]
MSSQIEISSPANVAPGLTYEHAARAGDFIFVSGQIAKDEAGVWVGGDATNQAKQVYLNLDRVLAHMGATRNDVVKVHTILVDLKDKDAVTQVRLDYFGDHRPPHTGTIVAALGLPEIVMEVEVVAYAPRSKADQ